MYQLNPLFEGKIGKMLSGDGIKNLAGRHHVKSARRAAAKALKDARRGIERVEAGPFSYNINHGPLAGANRARRIQDTIYNNLRGNDRWVNRKDLTKVM